MWVSAQAAAADIHALASHEIPCFKLLTSLTGIGKRYSKCGRTEMISDEAVLAG